MALFKQKEPAEAEAGVSENETSRIYEIGYHIMPSVSEENVSTEVETIKGLISKHGGTVVSEGEPKLTDLAYTMRKRLEGGYKNFDKAYFGWVKFETDQDNINSFSEDIDELESILRFIVVKTIKENTLYGDSLIIESEESEEGDNKGQVPTKEEPVKAKTGEEEKEEKGEVVEEELDEKLDELISDDKVE